MIHMTKEEIIKIFSEKFGNDTPEVYTSPGRINLIGNIPITTAVLSFPVPSTRGLRQPSGSTVQTR